MQQRLTILLDHNDLACIEARCPAALSGTLLVFDAELHVRLLESGIGHLTPWDVVGRGEYEQLVALDADAWRFWQDAARAVYRGVDFLDMARYRHMCCLTRLAWAAYVIRRALETLCPSEVVTFEELEGHGLDQPAGDPKMPLLFALVRGMAEQAGVAVRLIRRAEVAGQEAFVDRTALAAARSLPPVSPEEVLGDRPYVLFVGSGVDLLRQLPVMRELHRTSDLAAVQMYKSADDRTVERLHEQGHPVWHESQVTRTAEFSGDESWITEARRAFDLRRRAAPPPLRGIFSNPYMNIHFDFIFGDYLKRMAWHVEAWGEFLGRHRPRAVVANYAAPILDIAANMDIPCLVLAHGLMVMGDTRLYLGLPRSSQIGAISHAHRQRLLAAGIVPHRVHVTGDPGLDELIVRTEHDGDERQTGSPSGCCSGRRTILLTTANITSAPTTTRLPEVGWKDAVRCFEQLADLAERRPEWRFLIKCHPRYDHHLLYERVNRRLSPDRRMAIVSDRSLEQLVQDADVVVFPNTRTSAILEASLWDKPVFILQTSMIWTDQRAWGTDQWPQLNAVAELESDLVAVFSDLDLYQQRAAQTRDALGRYFESPLAPSIPRCAELIAKLADTCAKGCLVG